MRAQPHDPEPVRPDAIIASSSWIGIMPIQRPLGIDQLRRDKGGASSAVRRCRIDRELTRVEPGQHQGPVVLRAQRGDDPARTVSLERLPGRSAPGPCARPILELRRLDGARAAERRGQDAANAGRVQQFSEAGAVVVRQDLQRVDHAHQFVIDLEQLARVYDLDQHDRVCLRTRYSRARLTSGFLAASTSRSIV